MWEVPQWSQEEARRYSSQECELRARVPVRPVQLHYSGREEGSLARRWQVGAKEALRTLPRVVRVATCHLSRFRGGRSPVC